MVANSFIDLQIEELEQQAQGGKHEDADYMLQVAKEFKAWIEKKDKPVVPDTSQLSPELKAYFDKQNSELEAERAKLGLQKKEQTVAEKKAARDAYDQGVQRSIGSSVGKRLKDYIAEKEKSGAFIPSYVTAQKDPKTGISSFALNILNAFNEKCESVSLIKDHLEKLKRMPASESAAKQRHDYAVRLIDDFLPDIIDAEVAKVQTNDNADRQRRGECS